MDATETTVTLNNIKVAQLSADQSPLIGIALVAHSAIVGAAPAVVTDGMATLEVPLRFYRGNLNLIRAEMHKIVDDAIEALI